jgi:hypothetical protein
MIALLEREASTRALGLMRLGTALLLWARFGREMMPMRDLSPDRVALSLAFFVATSGAALGLFTRASMLALALVMGVMVIGYGGYGDVDDWAHHHTTLHMLAVWWLALSPCGRSFSLDRWWAQRRADAAGAPWPLERGPVWATGLIASLLVTVYWWSVVDKLDNHFLNGVQLQQIAMEYYFGAQPPVGPLWSALWPTMAWAVVLLEIVLPLGLLWPRARSAAAVVGVLMHAGFYVLLPVQTFTLQMILLYLAFFDPDDVHRAIDRALGHREG